MPTLEELKQLPNRELELILEMVSEILGDRNPAQQAFALIVAQPGYETALIGQ